MKKFNKVTTVSMQVNAEVLPINAVFVARAMSLKSKLECARHMFEMDAQFIPDGEGVDVIGKTLDDGIRFFNDLYDALTEDSLSDDDKDDNKECEYCD